MPCKESILNAKASFVAAVSEGIDTLIQQCGYSRDRATSALMRELSRGDSTRPSDKEVSDTNQSYIYNYMCCRRGACAVVWARMLCISIRKRSLVVRMNGIILRVLKVCSPSFPQPSFRSSIPWLNTAWGLKRHQKRLL